MKRKILSIDEYVAEEKMYESQMAEYDVLDEAENLREEYQKYFKETLESFGVASMGELPREKRSEFFSKIKEGWEKGKGRKGNVSEGDDVSDEEYKKAIEEKQLEEEKLTKLEEEVEECDDDDKKEELKEAVTGCKEKIKGFNVKISGYNGPLKENATVNEAEVKSDADFKEYAENKLKKAFGDDYDEAKAKEVIDGLLKKKADDDLDYGAIIGMLNK